MPIALRLALRQWFNRPLRPILCSIAIAAAVALIICVGAGFDSLRYSLNTAIGQLLGVAEVHVRASQKGTDTRVPAAMLETLRHRPEVEMANGRVQGFARLTKEGEEPRWFQTVGIDPVMDEKLRPKGYTSGHAFSGKADEITLDSGVADILSLRVGDRVLFNFDGTDATNRSVTIVGIVARPAIDLISKPTVYAPQTLFPGDAQMPLGYNVIDLKLRNVEDFDTYSTNLGKELGPAVMVSPGTTSKARMGNESHMIQMGLTLLSVVSGICAALIIGTTLSVGVQERIRQFGQLRCIGASRSQLVTFLAADALLLMIGGLIMGVALGLGLSSLAIHFLPQFFLAYKISASSLGIALANGCLATLVGTLVPIWQLTRVTPMAAVTTTAHRARSKRLWLAAVLGLSCLAIQAALWALIPSREVRFLSYTTVGIPLIFIGYTLLGPMCLIALEKHGATIIGLLMGIKPSLLRNAWSRTPWRAGAMIAALMIGVTLFTTVRARGESILKSWSFPAKFPDLVLFSPTSVSAKRIDLIRKDHPEAAEISGLAAFPVKMPNSAFRVGEVLANGSTNFVAVDPQSFPTMVEMDFIQGDRQSALRKLAEGGHILISKEFYNARGLGVGDKLTFLDHEGKTVDFTIAGVVTSNGMDMAKNYFDLRSTFQEAAISSVLGTLDDARKHFQLNGVNLMLLNLNPQAANAAASNKLREDLQQEGFQSASSVEMKTGIRDLIQHVVDILSIISVGGLCVASLGVANMVIASVHARRFEFGVLRAIGAGRWQLIRLVLAEVTLIGLVAGILGALAGLHFTFMGTLVDRTMVGFPTKFLSPTWPGRLVAIRDSLFVAAAITILLAWLASLLPAIKGAYAAQRTLLAGGRA